MPHVLRIRSVISQISDDDLFNNGENIEEEEEEEKTSNSLKLLSPKDIDISTLICWRIDCFRLNEILIDFTRQLLVSMLMVVVHHPTDIPIRIRRQFQWVHPMDIRH